METRVLFYVRKVSFSVPKSKHQADLSFAQGTRRVCAVSKLVNQVTKSNALDSATNVGRIVINFDKVELALSANQSPCC